MGILFTVVGIAYAAFTIWATVRIVNRREKRPKGMVAFIAAPCLYALSFGPMASLARHGLIPDWLGWALGWFYEPLILFLNDAPESASWLLNWISTHGP